MTVRPAQADDLDALGELLRIVDDLHAELLPTYFRKVRGRGNRRDTLERVLKSHDEVMLVVDEGAGAVGLIHVQIYDTPPVPIMVPRRRAHIDNIVVAEGARRRGYGAALVDAATRWARERGASEILLTVWTGNEAAERFYARLDFQRVNQVLGRPI